MNESFIDKNWGFIKVAMIVVTSITAFLLISDGGNGIFIAGILLLTGFIVYTDARNRGLSEPKAYVWAFGVFMLLIVVLPVWLITRPKKKKGSCPKCGRFFADQQFCPDCGTALGVQPSPS